MENVNIIILVLLLLVLALLVMLITIIVKMNNNFNKLENNVQIRLEANKTKKLESLNKSNSDFRIETDNKFSKLIQSNDNFNNNLFMRVDLLSKAFEERFDKLQSSNEMKLKEIQKTVDEQLQDILQKRINESFVKVNEHLISVQKGLGEMRDLASNVGDLKSALTNVKTRGIIGELQLSRILEQTLSKQQYVEQASIYPDTNRKVDFAIKLPGKSNDMNRPIYLPIDAKFPMDKYNNILAAIKSNDPQQIQQARHELYMAVKKEAKSINEKYIQPPITTDFALIFFPAEGLYAEIINNIDLTEELFHKFKINVVGPSTITAYLNSLQLGFKTIAIEQKSGEIYKVLEEVKIEFSKYNNTLEKVKEKIDQANTEMNHLMSTRTNKMQIKLNKVNELEHRED